jgi:hypothetical protein
VFGSIDTYIYLYGQYSPLGRRSVSSFLLPLFPEFLLTSPAFSLHSFLLHDRLLYTAPALLTWELARLLCRVCVGGGGSKARV